MNDLEQLAIERLKAASDMSFMAYQQPLVICISGGKDSGVITELAVRSGIPLGRKRLTASKSTHLKARGNPGGKDETWKHTRKRS